MDATAPARSYVVRVVDHVIDELLPQLPAIVFEGPKAVGKTATAVRRARTVHRLDDPAQLEVAAADPIRLLEGARPVLIDEWQRLPQSWDGVRRAVDGGAGGGSFLLTGSAIPGNLPAHSGAGRIVSLRMRPLSLAERGAARPTVSLAALLRGEASIGGESPLGLRDYTNEILRSGFPGIRNYTGRALRAQLDGYLRLIVEREVAELGYQVRRPRALEAWLRAYAAATATSTTFEKIREAATSADGAAPTRDAAIPYRHLLERLWILDPVPAWTPTRSHISRLASPPKLHLADPALAARALGLDARTLLEGNPPNPPIPRDGTFLGALFDSLVTLSVRVYAEAAEAGVRHLRTFRGEHEIDIIVERADGRILALEVKLKRAVVEADGRNLGWLRERIGDQLIDSVIVTTGPAAYRRPDGIAVVPAALLGP